MVMGPAPGNNMDIFQQFKEAVGKIDFLEIVSEFRDALGWQIEIVEKHCAQKFLVTGDEKSDVCDLVQKAIAQSEVLRKQKPMRRPSYGFRIGGSSSGMGMGVIGAGPVVAEAAPFPHVAHTGPAVVEHDQEIEQEFNPDIYQPGEPEENNHVGEFLYGGPAPQQNPIGGEIELHIDIQGNEAQQPVQENVVQQVAHFLDPQAFINEVLGNENEHH